MCDTMGDTTSDTTSDTTAIDTSGNTMSDATTAVQGDILRPLRLPALLVGDHKLGGISTTLSAYDSLVLRCGVVPGS